MEPKKRADARRAALSRYAVQLYTMASEGKLKHSDMVQRAIDFAVVNARRDFPFSYRKGSHTVTDAALKDLMHVLVGEGIMRYRAQGKHNVQKKLDLEFRRGASGFHKSMIDNGDQINHTFGALLGGYYYPAVFEKLAQLREEHPEDRAVNRRGFHAANQLDDSNLDSLGSKYRAMLESDVNLDLPVYQYTKAERGNIELIIRQNSSHKSWILKKFK